MPFFNKRLHPPIPEPPDPDITIRIPRSLVDRLGQAGWQILIGVTIVVLGSFITTSWRPAPPEPTTAPPYVEDTSQER